MKSMTMKTSFFLTICCVSCILGGIYAFNVATVNALIFLTI